jgi:hypothetical protein
MTVPADAPEGAAGGARPFSSPDDAWFWTMAALVARRDGAGIGFREGLVARPCDPEDVLRCLDRAYRAGTISADQVRVMRIWGELQREPDGSNPEEREAAWAWATAMLTLLPHLRSKGIVEPGAWMALLADTLSRPIWPAAALPVVTTAQTSVCG